jgi:hypothetical protein
MCPCWASECEKDVCGKEKAGGGAGWLERENAIRGANTLLVRQPANCRGGLWGLGEKKRMKQRRATRVWGSCHDEKAAS